MTHLAVHMWAKTHGCECKRCHGDAINRPNTKPASGQQTKKITICLSLSETFWKVENICLRKQNTLNCYQCWYKFFVFSHSGWTHRLLVRLLWTLTHPSVLVQVSYLNATRGRRGTTTTKKKFPRARRPLPSVLAVSLPASHQLFQTCLRTRALPNKVDEGRRLERRRERRTGGGGTVIAGPAPLKRKDGGCERNKMHWKMHEFSSFFGFFFGRIWVQKREHVSPK